MIALAILGGLMVAAGLGGLGYCAREGFAIRRDKPEAAVAAARLRRLVPVNLASVCVAALGLGLVTVALVMG